MAEQSGIGAPIPVDDYVPVHPEDRKDRVCYRVSNSANADLQCLVEYSEVGPATSWNGDCSGDSELPDGYSWCDYSYLKDEFDLRYGEKEAFPPWLLKHANENGLGEPQPVNVRGPDEPCYRFGPEEGVGTWCWYERVKSGMYTTFGPCTRGYAGSFWCRYGDELPPHDATWTWSWTDPRD